MRRICLDIASNYFFDGRNGFLNEPSQARAYFQDQTIKFYAATTFNSASRKFKDFTDHKRLIKYLVEADELISFNGRTCDLIVLEKFASEEMMRNVWLKPHHDLRGWNGGWSLNSAVSIFLPDIASSFERVKSERLAEIGSSVHEPFIADHLADTYRDVYFTFELFQKYLMRGDSEHTFHDG